MIDSVDDVKSTVLGTFYEMIKSFVEHLPFVFGAISTLLLTWAITLASMHQQVDNS